MAAPHHIKVPRNAQAAWIFAMNGWCLFLFSIISSAVDRDSNLMPLVFVCQTFCCQVCISNIVLNILIDRVSDSYFVKTGGNNFVLSRVAFLQHDVAKLQHTRRFLLYFCNGVDWTKKLYSVSWLTLKNFSDHSILLQCFVDNKLMLNKENVTWQWVQKIKSS